MSARATNRALAVLLAMLMVAGGLYGCGTDAAGDGVLQSSSSSGGLDGVITGDGGISDGAIDAPDPPDASKVCAPDCPAGYVCANLGDGPRCVVAPELACKPCASDAGCLGGSCTTIDGKGPYCLIPCAIGPGGNSCPSGYNCSAQLAGIEKSVCVPVTASCTCTAATAGKVEPCAVEGGKCNGGRTCGASGWGECIPLTVQPEICDGIDNDCDGTTDEDLAEGGACSIDNVHGSCPGAWQCAGGDGLKCVGEGAQAEVCDGADNDCDGLTDEPWLVGGVYTGDSHCGACGNDCSTAFAGGVGACNPAGKPPHCIVAKCSAGYVLGANGCVKIPDPCPGGDCTCTAADDGKERICTVKTDAGQCQGVEHCEPGKSWIGCTAKTPVDEICNGLDDDCDGAIDQGLAAGKACAKTNVHGTCSGTSYCKGSAGWLCDAKQALAEVCNGKDDNCDGATDEPFTLQNPADPAKNGKIYGTADHCGGCGQACKPILTPHVLTNCVPDWQLMTATCANSCEKGWIDANESLIDGCECKFVSDKDDPGAGDANCDGVDGDKALAWFVAKHGSDSNPGTVDKPFATIGKALTMPNTAKADIYVAAGTYTGNLATSGERRVFGGFNATFSEYDPGTNATVIRGTTVQGAQSIAVDVACKAAGALPTRFSGLTVQAADGAPGYATAAMRVTSCGASFAVDGCRLIGGRGGDAKGGTAGANGAKGNGGSTGVPAKDVGHPGCYEFDSNKGGKGGELTCGDTAVSGGAGGDAACPDYHSTLSPPQCSMAPVWQQTAAKTEHGRSGVGPSQSGGAGGTAGWDGYIDPNDGKASACVSPGHGCNRCETGLHKVGGDNGKPGAQGVPGAAGGGCGGLGTVVAGAWQGATGADGGDGTHGAGGGGGGASGGIEVVACKQQAGYSDIGGSGGGGGSGGCAGTGGKAGKPGGASFVVLIVQTASGKPSFVNNEYWGGQGGNGGIGGAGGFGGFGGLGRSGGAPGAGNPKTFCAYGGGAGGTGGSGGHGGGGGGGCGGPALIFGTVGQPASVISGWLATGQVKQAPVGGGGGAGGASPENKGKDGLPGVAKNGQAW